MSRDSGPRLGALLRLAYQQATQEMSRQLEESGHGVVQVAHLAVIQPLWDEPEGARLTTLAAAGRMTKQSMSALVDHLERHGYVERGDDPDDARASRIRLTAKGRALAKANRAFIRTLEARWGERVGHDRIEQLRETLAAIVATTGDTT